MKILGAMLLTLGLFGVAFAADTTSKPATPACCGEKCKTMGNCCKADAAGKVTCDMSGSCCTMPK